jgi:hypothetical protein
MAAPDAAAADWLKANGVPELFDALTARLVAAKPADVVQFLLSELHALAGAASPEGQLCAAKMRAAGAHELHIRAFLQNHKAVAAGSTGTLPEGSLVPVSELPELATMSVTPRPELVKATVVLKLNGGLGTGMGLSKAKSLLPIKDGNTFLDYIAMQVLSFRETTGSDLRFMLMNSFSTSDDTREYLAKYAAFAGSRFVDEVEVMQGKTPKVSQATLKPASYPAAPDNEWCPPGHGELYCSLQSSGQLDALLAKGFKYMFVSNSDNLGATLDLSLLTYLADEGHEFLMEVCQRTESDKKGATSRATPRRARCCCASRRSAPRKTRPSSRTSASTASSTPTTCGSTLRRCARPWTSTMACSLSRPSATSRPSTPPTARRRRCSSSRRPWARPSRALIERPPSSSRAAASPPSRRAPTC